MKTFFLYFSFSFRLYLNYQTFLCPFCFVQHWRLVSVSVSVHVMRSCIVQLLGSQVHFSQHSNCSRSYEMQCNALYPYLVCSSILSAASENKCKPIYQEPGVQNQVFSGKVPMTDSPALKSHNSQIFHNPVTTCPLDTGTGLICSQISPLYQSATIQLYQRMSPRKHFQDKLSSQVRPLGCIVLQSTHRYNLKCCTGVINVISGPYNGSWSEDSEGHFVFRNQLICPQVGHN